jgi:hypothetical protein
VPLPGYVVVLGYAEAEVGTTEICCNAGGESRPISAEWMEMEEAEGEYMDCLCWGSRPLVGEI